MKKLYSFFIIAIIITGLAACNKETPTTQIDIMSQMIANKNWYLDYSIKGSSVKSYVGQTTYFVMYLKNGTTKDSDGLFGNYIVEIINKQSQIHVQALTSNGNRIEFIYDIMAIGDKKLVLEQSVIGQSSPTLLYFTSN